jgi:hypothetical protein
VWRRLTDPAFAPLRIGSDVWTTDDLAVKVGVGNTRAARKLSKAAESIGAKNIRDLYARSSPYTFAGIMKLGDTAMYVLWRVFESVGLDPEQWATAGGTAEALVSFRSLKKRELQAEARTRKDARRRSRGARRQSHEAGVAAALR